MKVGIVTTWFERGAGIVSRQLRDALNNAGVETFIYARGERYAINDPKWDSSDVHWGRRLHWSGSGKIHRADFESWLAEHEIDAVIFNEQRWWQPILWAKCAGVKCGAYVDYYTRESVPLFAAYDFLICNTRRHHEAFAWHPGAVYVPWGTDTSVFIPTQPAQRPLRFFHSCGWDPHRKGTDLVLAAFERIRGKIDAELLIHSQVDIDDPRARLSGVTVHKATVKAPGLYHLGDIYVYPSRLEGIGLTICEALACGLPVITTDEPPMSEFVEHGVSGFLVSVERRFERKDGYYWPMSEASVPALAKAMLSAAQLSCAELDEMKKAARRIAVRERSWSFNSNSLAQIVAEAPRSAVDRQLASAITKFDHKGKGRIDVLLLVPVIREIFSLCFALYRRLRQPHLYGSIMDIRVTWPEVPRRRRE